MDSPRSRRSLSYNCAAASTREPSGAFLISSLVMDESNRACSPARMSARLVLNDSTCPSSIPYTASVRITLTCEQSASAPICRVDRSGWSCAMAMIFCCVGVGPSVRLVLGAGPGRFVGFGIGAWLRLFDGLPVGVLPGTALCMVAMLRPVVFVAGLLRSPGRL